MSRNRPVIRYHGGKWLLAPWIIGHLPPHQVYVEPFGGGGSVLMRKPRSYAEVYNDLDDEIVGLFRVLRDPLSAARLEEVLRLTPFARQELKAAYGETDDPIERARRLVVRCFMGFGSDGHNMIVMTGFRANSNRSGTTPAQDWRNWPGAMRAMTDRLQGVVIECRPGIEVMRAHDAPNAVHYVDPPYLPETRSKKTAQSRAQHGYKHEMTVEDHEELLWELCRLNGAVLVSGYPSEMYDRVLHKWQREEREAMADGARPRIEVLWWNEAAEKRLHGHRSGQGTPLFMVAK